MRGKEETRLAAEMVGSRGAFRLCVVDLDGTGSNK